MNPLYLIDASVFVFRSYFSMDESLTDARGESANAVFGFGMFLCDLLRRAEPEQIAVAFDESLTTSFRNELYPAYKANRPPAPEDLKRQFNICMGLTRALGIPALASDRYEADDLIGTLATRSRAEGRPVIILTADKDLAQLVREDDVWWDYHRRKRLDYAGVRESFGVGPELIADLLGFAGDAVDNIPGVPGIGMKTAVTLLQHMPGMDAVYDGLDGVLGLPLRGAKRVHGLLGEHRDQAFLSRDLSTIHCDVPLDIDIEDLVWQGGDSAQVEALGLTPGLARKASALSG